MVKLHNPALHAEPRNQPPAIIPPRQDSSFLEWLARTKHLMFREAGEHHYDNVAEEILETLDTNELSSFAEEQGNEP